MTDWRALCVQLADELERYRPLAEVPDCLQLAHAALAEPVPAPPAEGEVAELVTALRGEAVNCTCTTLTNGDLRRAADLLEGHHG